MCVRCEHPCMRLHCITNLYLIFTTTDNQTLSSGGRYIAIKGHLAKDVGGGGWGGAAATFDRFSAL